MDNIRKDDGNNVSNANSEDMNEDAVIELLQLIIQKLYEFHNEVARNKAEIHELREMYKKLSLQPPPVTGRTVAVEKDRVIIQENYIDYIAEQEPKLKEEFHLFIDSDDIRLKELSNVSSPEYADFLLVDSKKIEKYHGFNKDKIIVILSDKDNTAKYSEYNIIRQSYTEKQIYRALKIVSDNRLAFQSYNYIGSNE